MTPAEKDTNYGSIKETPAPDEVDEQKGETKQDSAASEQKAESEESKAEADPLPKQSVKSVSKEALVQTKRECNNDMTVTRHLLLWMSEN